MQLCHGPVVHLILHPSSCHYASSCQAHARLMLMPLDSAFQISLPAGEWHMLTLCVLSHFLLLAHALTHIHPPQL